MTEFGILIFLLLFTRVKNTDFVSKASLGSVKELKVGLDRVHRDNQVVFVGMGVDVLQANECLALLWFPDDRA
jgi:hypothetical protein